MKLRRPFAVWRRIKKITSRGKYAVIVRDDDRYFTALKIRTRKSLVTFEQDHIVGCA
jgi:hypothetical protein